MALFALWPDRGDAAAMHARVEATSHLRPERRTAVALETAGGRWQVAAHACATRFYSAEAQVWLGEGEACLIHGLVWREDGLLDAAAVARLLRAPGDTLPDSIMGEFAVARLYPCGTLTAFSDPAGVHQLFHRSDRPGALASRAAFLAHGDEPDAESGRWLAAVGYRVGEATGWRGVRQLAQGQMLVATPDGASLRRLSAPDLAGPRGFDEALLDAGIHQGKAAIRLAAGDGPLDLPVTGGKDSRAVLALALAAGMAERLTLTTRGLPDHPDVRVAELLAEAIGVPHRRDPPRGSDGPADMTVDAFVDALATHAWQTDGGMGGWDLLVATCPGRETLVTGHMGEVLKAYAKRRAGDGPLDPIDVVRLQSPFDPLGLLRPESQAAMAADLAAQMAEWRAAGAAEDDLPDLFYHRNRLPNWLGGVRGVRSHERQPMMPLAAPALQRLAWAATGAERRAETIHYRIVERCAPALLPLPFAHQRWPAALGAPDAAPLLAPAGSALFGNWQWSVNHVPAIRAWLTDFFAATDLALWDHVDRARLIDALRHRRFDYADLIALLGLTAHAFHAAGLVRRQRIGGEAPPPVLLPQPVDTIRPTGHLDVVLGATRDGNAIRVGDAAVELAGWAWLPEWPGATPVVEAFADHRPVAATPAAAMRADLAAAGIGDGGHGFTLRIPPKALAGAAVLEIPGIARLDVVP